jgi:hypothetical protein
VPDEIRAVPDHVELASDVVRRQYSDVNLDAVSGAVERCLDLVTRIDEEGFSIVMSRYGGKLLSEPVCLTAKAFGGGGGHRSSSVTANGARKVTCSTIGQKAEPLKGEQNLGCGILGDQNMTHGRVTLAAKACHIEGMPHIVGHLFRGLMFNEIADDALADDGRWRS